MRGKRISDGDIVRAKLYRVNGVVVKQTVAELRDCPHRGEQVRTMTSDLCGTRGHNLPVYACELHGECTHRQVCRGQDAAVRICVGCSDGPWAFT